MTWQPKPGDVAITPRGNVIFYTSAGWRSADGRNTEIEIWAAGLVSENARPLVVLDPESDEDVDRLLAVMRNRGWTGLNSEAPDDMQAVLRALANPAPPRISEPGLWGVVEAKVEDVPRRRWVHHEEDRWVSDEGTVATWEALSEPTLVRDGLAAE